MNTNASQKTGDAKIVRNGHTASSKFGTDPSAKAIRPASRDLTAK